MSKDLKEITIELMENGKIAHELKAVSNNVLSIVKKSIVVSDQEETVDTSSIFQIYTRREENLRKQGVKCVGLAETLSAIQSADVQFKIVSFGNEEYITTVFMRNDNEYLVGMFYMPINIETFNRIKHHVK